jgi:hypothetical protein
MFRNGRSPLTIGLALFLAIGLARPGRAADAVPLLVPRPIFTDALAVSLRPLEIAAPGIDDEARPPAAAAIRAIVEEESEKAGLPADIAETVVRIESGYDPTAIGGVGEIGLMQVRPSTAAMLGFRGSAAELAKPDINIHYGVIYLGQAWRLANGDLCRALMKYRAGHGQEVMTPLSIAYCNRARDNLAALRSPLATVGASSPVIPVFAAANPKLLPELVEPKSVYRKFKQGTPAASRAYWALQAIRVRTITAMVQAKWHQRVASRLASRS